MIFLRRRSGFRHYFMRLQPYFWHFVSRRWEENADGSATEFLLRCTAVYGGVGLYVSLHLVLLPSFRVCTSRDGSRFRRLEEVTDAEGVVLVLPVVIAVEAEAVAEVQAFVDIETYSEVHAEGAVPVAIFPGGSGVSEVEGHQGAYVAEEYGAVTTQTGLDANLVGVGIVEFVGVLGGEYIPGEILVEGVFPTDVEFNLCSDAEFSTEAHAFCDVLGLHLHGSACDGGKCNSFFHFFSVTGSIN